MQAKSIQLFSRWMIKICGIANQEYYSVLKRNELSSQKNMKERTPEIYNTVHQLCLNKKLFKKTQKFKHTFLSERSPSEKATYYTVPTL